MHWEGKGCGSQLRNFGFPIVPSHPHICSAIVGVLHRSLAPSLPRRHAHPTHQALAFSGAMTTRYRANMAHTTVALAFKSLESFEMFPVRPKAVSTDSPERARLGPGAVLSRVLLPEHTRYRVAMPEAGPSQDVVRKGGRFLMSEVPLRLDLGAPFNKFRGEAVLKLVGQTCWSNLLVKLVGQTC